MTELLLEATGVTRTFRTRGGPVEALRGVDLAVELILSLPVASGSYLMPEYCASANASVAVRDPFCYPRVHYALFPAPPVCKNLDVAVLLATLTPVTQIRTDSGISRMEPPPIIKLREGP